jgi:hypothetical protein
VVDVVAHEVVAEGEAESEDVEEVEASKHTFKESGCLALESLKREKGPLHPHYLLYTCSEGSMLAVFNERNGQARQ